MAKIYCPNKDYTGISASVSFADGKGETENENLIKWFKEHGYTVEDECPEGGESGIANMTVDELKALAAEKKIDIGNATSVAGIIKKIQAASEQ